MHSVFLMLEGAVLISVEGKCLCLHTLELLAIKNSPLPW